jgi:hypothetical protein
VSSSNAGVGHGTVVRYDPCVQALDLLGRWVIDPTDETAVAAYGQASMEFRDDGSLVYSIAVSDRIQVVLLTYGVSGNELITDQPSAPQEERTRFSLTSEGKLILLYEGAPATFLREP